MEIIPQTKSLTILSEPSRSAGSAGRRSASAASIRFSTPASASSERSSRSWMRTSEEEPPLLGKQGVATSAFL